MNHRGMLATCVLLALALAGCAATADGGAATRGTAELVVSARLSRDWMYPSWPICENRSELELTVQADEVTSAGESPQVTVSATPAECLVRIVPTGSPLRWRVVARNYPTHGDLPGSVTLAVTVRNPRNGASGHVTVPLRIRLVGDINDNGLVNAEDKLLLNERLNDIAVDRTDAELDLNSDGAVTAEDKRFMNLSFCFLPPPGYDDD